MTRYLLIELAEALEAAEEDQKDRLLAWKDICKVHAERRAKTLEAMAAAATPINWDLVAAGLRIISVHGSFLKGGRDAPGAVADAILWLQVGRIYNASGQVDPYLNLWTHYFGTKTTLDVQGVRTNCTYGRRPRSGRVLFRVGLSEEARELYDNADQPPASPSYLFSPAEINAAMHYLLNLQTIEEQLGEIRQK